MAANLTYYPKLRFAAFLFVFLNSFSNLSAQVTVQQLDQMASYILSVNGLDLYGEIRVDQYAAQGFAATTGNNRYSVIYVDPYKLRSLSVNTWAFIVSHELAHQYLGHNAMNASAQNEFEADRHGAYWAWQAGYDVNAYLQYMASEPNLCTISHGCWHDRIRNIMEMFGMSYYSYCN